MQPLVFRLFCVAFVIASEMQAVPATEHARPAPQRVASSAWVSRGPAEPPWWPGDVNVINGCHLSALRFIARFADTYPLEQAKVFVLGSRKLRRRHTIAVVTWRGQWWGRDEYLGVFPLDLSTAASFTANDFSARAHAAYEKHNQPARRQSRALAATPRARLKLTYERRLAEVQLAAGMVPGPARVYSVHGDGRRVPLLFFSPEPGWIAVYDPPQGTALVEWGEPDPERAVQLIAERLGYRGDRIHSHPVAPRDAPQFTSGPGP